MEPRGPQTGQGASTMEGLLSVLTTFVKSSLSVTLSHFASYPLEMWKLVDQHKYLLPNVADRSVAPISILKQRVGRDGWGSLWAGFSLQLLKDLPMLGFRRFFLVLTAQLFGELPMNAAYWAVFWRNVLMSSTMSSMATLAFYPLDTICTFVSTTNTKESLGAILAGLSRRADADADAAHDVMTRLFPVTSALYAGVPMMLITNTVYRAISMYLYDKMMPLLRKYRAGFVQAVLASMAISVTSTLITQPLENIRTHQMILSMLHRPGSITDAAGVIFEQRGILGFFSGSALACLREILAVAIHAGSDFIFRPQP